MNTLQNWTYLEKEHLRILGQFFYLTSTFRLLYIIFRQFGDSKHCRKVLQRALNSVTDWPESVVDAYINFERLEGNVC